MLTLHKHSGFTLVEMIIVIVITGIIGGIVAIFIRAPVQGYMDSARRAELTDIADTAMRRMARDVRTAVPNSMRTLGCGGTPCVEFLPTKDGGRYRADQTGGGVGCGTVASSTLDFSAADTCFEIVGSKISFSAGDQIVVGSTQSDGNPPYQDPTAAVCGTVDSSGTNISTCIRRPIAAAGVGVQQVVKVNSIYALPGFANLSDANPPSQRFDVVDGTQQAVTYACVATGGGACTTVGGNGTCQLVRYSSYGFNAVQILPVVAGAPILANKVSACSMVYDLPSQRFGLLAVSLTLTSGGESVSLYNEIHVNNVP
jgi:MSHA biogenesis protein MshO